MSHNCFNIHDMSHALDWNGTKLSRIDEVRLIAIRYAGETFRDDAEKIVLDEDWRLEVLDEAGKPAFDIKLHLHQPVANIDGCK